MGKWLSPVQRRAELGSAKATRGVRLHQKCSHTVMEKQYCSVEEVSANPHGIALLGCLREEAATLPSGATV
jgi:hypothetical protein